MSDEELIIGIDHDGGAFVGLALRLGPHLHIIPEPFASQLALMLKDPPYIERGEYTGGPAFPANIGVGPCGDVFLSTDRVETSGMSLRDWFAGMALQGDWAAQNEQCGFFYPIIPEELLIQRAQLYFRAADAMLKVRGRK